METITGDFPPQITETSIFRNKAFLTLWINQILLQVSYNILNFSLIILVFHLTNSNTITATFLLMAMLPAILFGVFAGVVTDRFDKRKILLYTDIGIGVIMLAFIPIQSAPVFILFVAFILNAVFQFFIPAEAATLPTVVRRENLLTANAIFQFTPTAALIIGSSAAGPVVANFGYTPVFLFGATAMLGTFFIRRMLPPLPPSEQMAFDNKKESLLRLVILSKNDIKKGLEFILSDNRIWVAILVLAFIQAAGGTIAILAPAFMEQVLHIQATDASLVLLLPLGIGIGIGALLTTTVSRHTPARLTVIRGLLICGVAAIAMVLTPAVGHSIGNKEFVVTHLRPFFQALTVAGWISFFALVVGFGFAQVIIPAQTSLQQHTKVQFRGRVFAVWSTLIALSVSLPALLVGALADIFGVVWAMALVGVVTVLLGLSGFRAEYITGRLIPSVVTSVKAKLAFGRT